MPVAEEQKQLIHLEKTNEKLIDKHGIKIIVKANFKKGH